MPPDPLGVPEPHDVLAAEEFGIGTRDDRWPTDPSGYNEPHDVLAAEQFAMPLPDAAGGSATQPGGHAWPLVAVGCLALGALALLARRRA